MERPSASIRKPSVTPECGMGRAITLADPTEKSSAPTSMVISSPRNCSMWIGNTGGCTAACSASFRRALGLGRPVHGQAGARVVQWAEERDAQDVVEVQMGQQRRGVQRRAERPHLLLQDVAQARRPVPRSTMSGSSPSMSITRHDVFPP